MNFLGLEIKLAPKGEKKVDISSSSKYSEYPAYGYNYTPISQVWDGEKTLGELGVPVRNIPDFDILRIRSYDAYAKSDVVKIICSKIFNNTVGAGLKLQAEPNDTVLKSEGISADLISFQKLVEARFTVYAKSKEAHYLKQKTLHEIAMDALQSKYLGGDLLAILRFGDNGPNLQLVLGEHIKNPSIDTEFLAQAESRGNKIEHGIEIDKEGNHIAYYICTKEKDEFNHIFERIVAKGDKSNRPVAWLISGAKVCPDHLRAVPEISQSLEKIAKLDRYTEAAVGKAEQAAKVFNVITHDKNSNGEDPYRDMVNKRRGGSVETTGDVMALGDGLANRMTETTSNQTFNMPIGASMESFNTNIETDFGVFHSHVFNIVSAGLNVPPEVAMQMYNSNYSASRAAINAYGYTVDINREKISNEIYIPFYKAWLEFEILKNKINAPEYITALFQKNIMITESYSQCRFIGKNMPHIDPLKEVKAVSEALLQNLISREQATESLGYGSWEENYKKKLEEDKILPKEIVQTNNSSNNGQKNKT